MTQFGVINLGRFPLVEFPTQAATDASTAPSSTTPTGRTLKLQGQESVPAAREIATTSAQLEAWRSDLAGLAGSFLPVTFTDKTGLNGYYIVNDSTADLQNWEGEQQTLTWSVDLTRIGTDFEIDIESRLTGTTRNNSFSLSGTRWHSPSIGHYAYFTAVGNTPSVVNRVGADGTHVVYVNLPSSLTTIPRWGCAVGNYMSGRVSFTDQNNIERSGILFTPANPNTWTIANGLIKVLPTTDLGVIQVSTYNTVGGYTGGKSWDFRFNGTSLGLPIGVSLLRNEPEIVVLRMVFAYQTVTRITCDLTVRRGARHVEVFLQSQVSGQFKVMRAFAETATSATGYLVASAFDTGNDKYVVGSALFTTFDLANGGISSSASVTYMDAMVGAQINTSAAGDQAVDLYNQYLATPSELVQGIRR